MLGVIKPLYTCTKLRKMWRLVLHSIRQSPPSGGTRQHGGESRKRPKNGLDDVRVGSDVDQDRLISCIVVDGAVGSHGRLLLGAYLLGTSKSSQVTSAGLGLLWSRVSPTANGHAKSVHKKIPRSVERTSTRRRLCQWSSLCTLY